MGATKKEFESVRIERYGLSYSVLREKNKAPQLMPIQKPLHSSAMHKMDKLDDYLNRWQQSAEFSD
jgi:hypothetical protein